MKSVVLHLAFLVVLNQGVAADLILEKSKKRVLEEPCLNLPNSEKAPLSLSDLPNDIRVLIIEKLIDNRSSKQINADLTSMAKVNHIWRNSVYKLDEIRWNRLLANAQKWYQKANLIRLAAQKGNAQLVEKIALIDKQFLFDRFSNLTELAVIHDQSNVIEIIYKYSPEALNNHMILSKPIAHLAIRYGKINILKTLAKISPEYLTKRQLGSLDLTIAHYIACNHPQVEDHIKIEIFKLIVQHAPEILNIKNRYNDTPTYIAAINGNELIFKELVQHNPEFLEDIFSNEVPVISNPEIIEIIYKFSPTLLTSTNPINQENLLHVAARKGHLKALKALLKYVPKLIKEKNLRDETPLDILYFNVQYFSKNYQQKKSRKIQDFIEELKNLYPLESL